MNLRDSMDGNFDYDVIIIGCGPAGSITARYIRPTKHNLRVLLIDRKKKIGLPVQCGEGILSFLEGQEIGSSTQDKKDLFECPERVKTHKIDQLQLVSPKHKIIEFPVQGYTINRDTFDQYLTQRAQEEGAILKNRISFLGFKDKHTIITNVGEITGNVIVGADGAFSSVAKSCGLQPPQKLAKCAISKIKGDFNDHTMKLFYGKKFNDGYGWIFSKGDHANVGLGAEFHGKTTITRNNLRKMLDDFIKKELIVKDSDIVIRGGGIVPVGGPIPRTVKDNVLIVGDAAGMVFPATGGGIDSAMIAGRECGTSIWRYFKLGEDLNNYEVKWRNILESDYKKGLRIKKTLQLMTRYDSTCELLFLIVKHVGLARFFM